MDKRPYVLIVGSDLEVAELLERMGPRSGDSGHKILGYLSLDGSPVPDRSIGISCLGSTKILRDYIFRNPVDVVLLLSSLSPAACEELLEPIFEIGLTVTVPRGVTVCLKSELLERTFIRHKSFLGLEATTMTTVWQSRGYLFAKKALDSSLSAILLIVFSPILLLIALAIKLSDPREPVLYPWHVLGKNGKPFVGYKFRTMVPNADDLKQEMLEFNEMQGPVFKMRNDPRITRLGRILRKFSLDELPQLYSVLKGDMSLVGPRPPSAQEAKGFEFWQRRKLSVTPGISCLWQINGRNDIHKFSEWVRLDLQYIQTASILLDLKIILLTIPAVLSARGAS
jgi:lipopolysaccharide/colanic/teichoic acid biosynthesis glycosyltransferase